MSRTYRRTSALVLVAALSLAVSDAPGASARVVKLRAGQATIERDGDREHVTVTDESGKVLSESWCDSHSGTYDELAAFFRRFQEAVMKGDPAAVARLVRFPLRVNGTRRRTVSSSDELRRQYDRIFVGAVTNKIRAADPGAVFCRDGRAMLGGGVAWAHSTSGRVAVDVINR